MVRWGYNLVKYWIYPGDIIQIQHCIEGSSKKNYRAPGVGCVRLGLSFPTRSGIKEEVKSHASNTEGPGIFTSRNKPCCICFTIPHTKYLTDNTLRTTLPWTSPCGVDFLCDIQGCDSALLFSLPAFWSRPNYSHVRQLKLTSHIFWLPNKYPCDVYSKYPHPPGSTPMVLYIILY